MFLCQVVAVAAWAEALTCKDRALNNGPCVSCKYFHGCQTHTNLCKRRFFHNTPCLCRFQGCLDNPIQQSSRISDLLLLQRFEPLQSFQDRPPMKPHRNDQLKRM
jgi:hypothetical protein